MLIFKFAGNLRRHFRQISLNVETTSQGLRLLFAQNKEFKKDFINSNLKIRVAGDDVDEENAKFHLDRHLKDGSTVLFVPAIEGAISGTVAAWIAVAIAAASVAYSIYSSRNMKNKNSAEAAQSDSITNNSFTSAENRVGQGRPVPLLLGEMKVGGNVISLGIDTTNNKDWTETIN